MKKIVVLFVLLSTLSLSAQDDEIKVDLLDILLLRTLDVTYEHTLNDEASIGIAAFVNFESRNTKFRYNENFQLTPFFRQFIKESGNFNVFGELFGTLNFAETKKDEFGKTRNYSDFALGLGAGAKRISNNGYIFEFNLGIARNLFNTTVSREFVPRFGISVGKQF